MSAYQYPQSKVIDEVVFAKGEGGAVRAYLHAAPGVDSQTLQAIHKTLHDRHWQMVPYTLNGKPMLEVRGASRESQLLSVLIDHGWVSGAIKKENTNDDHISFKDKIKKRSLFASGFFYVVGDVKFFTYGLKGSSPLDMAAGAFYGAGTASSLLFGRKDPSDLQIQDIAQHMAHYMNEQKITVPAEASIHTIIDDHKKGKIKKADDLLRRYPAELMNSFFALAGVCIAVAAYRRTKKPMNPEMVEQYMKKKIAGVKGVFPGARIPEADLANMRHEAVHKLEKFHKASSWLDVGLGSMTFSSGMFANLVDEKAHDPDAPKKEGLAAAWEYVQEHPMTVAGLGYMVSTLCHAVSTGIEWKIGTTEGKKAIFDRGVFVATNLIAELLVAISSKGHGKGVKSDASISETTLALAADLIAKQPAEMQHDLIEHVAAFLGQPDVLAIKDEEAKRRLYEQVEQLRSNPWCCVSDTARMLPAAASQEAAAWQAKVAAPSESHESGLQPS